MRKIFAGLIISTSLVSPAAALTTSQSVSVAPTSGGYVSGGFDLSGLIAAKALEGFDVVFTSGYFNFSGNSPRVVDPYTQVYNGSYSNTDCDIWGCSTHYWDDYTSYSGDRSTDHVTLNVQGQVLSDNTYNGYSTTTTTATIGGEHAHVHNRAYSSYGSVFAVATLSVANLAILNADGELDFYFYTTGDPFDSLTAYLSVNYDLVEKVSASAIPLPAGLPLLISAVGGLGFLARRRRRN